jgi:hypothetical protein
MEKVWDTAWSDLVGPIEPAYNDIAGPIEDIVNAVSKAASAVSSLIGLSGTGAAHAASVAQSTAAATSGKSGSPAGAHAAGGPVDGGAPYLVGELGPELFMPQGPGNIITNDDLQSLTQLGSLPALSSASSAASLTVTVTTSITATFTSTGAASGLPRLHQPSRPSSSERRATQDRGAASSASTGQAGRDAKRPPREDGHPPLERSGAGSIARQPAQYPTAPDAKRPPRRAAESLSGLRPPTHAPNDLSPPAPCPNNRSPNPRERRCRELRSDPGSIVQAGVASLQARVRRAVAEPPPQGQAGDPGAPLASLAKANWLRQGSRDADAKRPRRQGRRRGRSTQ